MLGSAAPWLAVFVSAAIILIQRTTITNLQQQLAAKIRTKRSSDLQNAVFVPVYAQLSKKAIHRMCKEKRYRDVEMVNFKDLTTATTTMATTTPTMTTTTTKATRKPQKLRSRPERKRCPSEVTLSDPQPIGTRPNTVGGAMRDGSVYYLTEFNIGYSILMFPSVRSLNHSEPKSMITLPYPFHGTDNTIYNGTVYYSYSDTVIAFNMNTGDMKMMQLNISTATLYKNSNSYVDIEADEHGVWILYRQDGEDYLTASRLQPISLKILSNWPLPAINPNLLCNAIIRCGLLYAVKCEDDKVTVSAIYDFYSNMYISGKQTVWKGMNGLTSVQYDPRSKTITIFDNGIVYTSTLAV